MIDNVADQIGREMGLFLSLLFVVIGVAGALTYGGKLLSDWRERRRVKKIMEGK